MMLFPDTTYRSADAEIMDDFSLEGDILRDALDKIAGINRFLGGNALTINGVAHLIKDIPVEQKITIVDIGCGNGDMLRALSRYGRRNKREFRLIGVDANGYTVSHARKLSEKYDDISYQCVDVFSPAFDKIDFDIATSTLTLHHFEESALLSLMAKLDEKTTIGTVINDLHRSGVSYRLFQLVCFIFGLNRMSREDGLTSILRGFRREDLESYACKLGLRSSRIRWKWAFRYQWIISKA